MSSSSLCLELICVTSLRVNQIWLTHKVGTDPFQDVNMKEVGVISRI